jgi:hypothetical protein
MQKARICEMEVSMSTLEGPHYTPSPVELQEIVGAWTAAKTRGGGLSLAGGQAILTPQYLVFTPWDMDQTRAWLVKGLSKAGFSYAEQINKLITATKLLEPVAIPIGMIASADPLNRASLFKTPTVRLQMTDGRHFDLGILHSPRTMTVSSKNNTAMEDFLSHLRSLLAANSP